VRKRLRKLWVHITARNVFVVSLLVFGLVGLGASTTISIEKTELIKHPDTKLICDLNPVYSCAKIIDSAPSKTLGMPNELMGIAMFTALITVGVILISGAKVNKWFWRAFMFGMVGFMLSVARLFYISVYRISALCILCSAVWFSGWVITVAGYAWLYDEKHIPKSKITGYIRRNIVGFWILLLMVAVFLALNHFWYYYGKYFGA
jgi:uncharacterized membrane protein